MSAEVTFPLSGRRVLVTGGSGFIGSRVVATLEKEGARPRCLLRPTSKTDRLAGLDYERVEGDVRDAASVKRAVEGCEGVIHAAGLSAWDLVDTPEAGEITLKGTRNLLETAHEQGVKKVVFVSTLAAVNSSEDPRPWDESAPFELQGKGFPYAEHKHEAEQLCLEWNRKGLPVCMVNPAETYGPNDTALVTAKNLVDFIKTTPLFLWTGGTAIVHVDDVAEGAVRALDRGRPGERYILASDNLSIEELAKTVLEIAGKKKRIFVLPNAVIRGAAKGAAALKLPFPMTPQAVHYAQRFWFTDNKKATTELGVKFRGARDVLTPTLAWLKQAGHIQ